MASRNRGRPKPSLRHISREHPSKEEDRAVMAAMIAASQKETKSPIVAAILGIGLIEYELERLLRRRLNRRDDETWDRLTEQGGPLDTFSAKIDLGYSLSLYDERLQFNMHLVRKIRNVFAHAKKLVYFDHELIKAELRTIHLPNSKRSNMYKLYAPLKELKSDAQWSYVGLCIMISSELLGRHTQMHTAAIRRMRRGKLQRFPAVTGSDLSRALLGFLGSPPPPLGDSLGFGLLSRTSDPSPEAPSPQFGDPPRSKPKRGGTPGKW
jgi:DNA-binding MltR family transcriptional regulator